MSEPGAVQRFFGALLIAAGGLIVLTCGLCSAGVLLTTLPNVGSGSPNAGELIYRILSVLGLVTFAGGLPAAIGGSLFFWGRRLRSGSKR
ncbi:MAG: hypothetical protein AB1429_03675 [Pseudomonadota bacterium]|jgi:hypothetical protein